MYFFFKLTFYIYNVKHIIDKDMSKYFYPSEFAVVCCLTDFRQSLSAHNVMEHYSLYLGHLSTLTPGSELNGFCDQQANLSQAVHLFLEKRIWLEGLRIQ